MRPPSYHPRTILVSGACGNLGRKCVEALARTPWCERIIGVDLSGQATAFSPEAQARLSLVQADLTRREASWYDALAMTDAIVHFAAQTPTPDATWTQALASFEMTANLLLAAAQTKVHRFVFASSNHVMGGYKDSPLADHMGPGRLTNACEPAPGTRWHNGTRIVYSLPYATSKAMGERLCQATAAMCETGLTTVSVRIGWIQAGDNDPRTITHSGCHIDTQAATALTPEDYRALRWFRNMWLSNADFCTLFTTAITADTAVWPTPSIIVNGVSNNRDMEWDLSSARTLIGYHPADDIYRHID